MRKASWLLTLTIAFTPAIAAGQAGQGASARPDPPPRPVPVTPQAPVLVPMHKVDAEYTEKARRAGIQGDVLLDVSVRADGKVGSVMIARSLDTMYGLDQRAAATVRQWTFAPLPAGDPRRVYPPTQIVVSFRLPSNAAAVVAPPLKAPEMFGEGAVRPGTPQLVLPKVKTRVEPLYTSAALRARITGVVKIEAVVMPDGTVGQARVTESLDQKTGLDDQALGAAREWIFEPATLNGRAVPVLVTLILEFRAH